MVAFDLPFKILKVDDALRIGLYGMELAARVRASWPGQETLHTVGPITLIVFINHWFLLACDVYTSLDCNCKV